MLELEKVARMNLLYDFYGMLLTERQRSVFELYYGQDLSLGEIAGEFGVSRQAVHDMLKRGGKTLEDYEARLGLAGKFVRERNKLAEVSKLLRSYSDTGDRAKLEQAVKAVEELLEAE